MIFNDDATLGEARAWLREQIRADGAPCPCCTQFAKVYRRKLNAGMARSLIAMYRMAGVDWQHVPTTTAGGSREEGKLRYWGLVEEVAPDNHTRQRVGWWRVTQTGEAFVLGKTKVPKHALIFDSRLLRLDDRSGYTDIYEALGSRFDYAVLMCARAGRAGGDPL